jgi:hypothetical protein
MEKARLRGKHALEKEILNENYNEILVELNILQQADREKRQKELINIPKDIFLPAWQREQNKNELQLDLERQFEKIYEDSNFRNNVNEEVPQPIAIDAESQSNFEDADLDLTLLDDVNDVSQQMRASISETPAVPVVTEASNKVAASSGIIQSQSENTTLNKLLDKIKRQREDYITKSNTATKKTVPPPPAPQNQDLTLNNQQAVQNQDTSLFSITNSSPSITNLAENQPYVENDNDSTQDEDYSSSSASSSSSVSTSSSFSLAESSVLLPATAAQNQAKKKRKENNSQYHDVKSQCQLCNYQ